MVPGKTPGLPIVLGHRDARVVRRPFPITAPIPDGHEVDVLGFADGDARGRNDPRLVARPFDAVDELFEKPGWRTGEPEYLLEASPDVT